MTYIGFNWGLMLLLTFPVLIALVAFFQSRTRLAKVESGFLFVFLQSCALMVFTLDQGESDALSTLGGLLALGLLAAVALFGIGWMELKRAEWRTDSK